MLRRRFQSASKPDPTRPETARQPTRCSKKPQRWAEKSPRRLPNNPTRLRTTPQTRIRRSKLTPRCLGIVHEAERLTDWTQMKNTHAQPFDVFTCQSPQNTRLCCADILSLLITTILQQSPVSFAHHHTCFCVVVMRTRQRRSHTNAFFNVIHLSVKNESTVVFYIDENVSKMNNNGHIASKTRKNFLPMTHDAYKML